MVSRAWDMGRSRAPRYAAQAVNDSRCVLRAAAAGSHAHLGLIFGMRGQSHDAPQGLGVTFSVRGLSCGSSQIKTMKPPANQPTAPQPVVLNGPGVLQIRRPGDLLQWHSIGMIDVVTLTRQAASSERDRSAIVRCDMSISDARPATLLAIYQGRIGNRKADKGPLTIEQIAAFADLAQTSSRAVVPIEVRLEALTGSQGELMGLCLYAWRPGPAEAIFDRSGRLSGVRISGDALPDERSPKVDSLLGHSGRHWVTDGGLRGRLESDSPNVAPIFKRWTL